MYLDKQNLSGFDLFSIAFQRDGSVVIPDIEYREEMKLEVKVQFDEYMNMMFLDDTNWCGIWTQWRRSHVDLLKRSWDPDEQKYLKFALLIRSLYDSPTKEELARFAEMLLNVPVGPPELPELPDRIYGSIIFGMIEERIDEMATSELQLIGLFLLSLILIAAVLYYLFYNPLIENSCE
jgi:hypothetical protein